MRPYNFLNVTDDFSDREAMIKIIGSNIKSVRLQKKLTQEQLSESAGIHPKYLGEIERGEKNPTALIIHKLSLALSVPICELMPSNVCNDNAVPFREIRNLVAFKKPSDVQKAVKILEVFFEQS